jgi:hypothetical protein
MGVRIGQSVQRLVTGWMADGTEFESRNGQYCLIQFFKTRYTVH